MVHSGSIDHVNISFLIAGHTKFAPDRLFSTTRGTYKCEDIDLHKICEQGGSTYIEDGSQVYLRREFKNV